MIGTRLAIVLVCALAAGVHLNTLGNGFALDDEPVIEHNADVHGLDRIDDAVTGPYWPIGAAHLGMYRPVTLATFAVDWEIWAGRPVGFHLTNVLLHVAVTALIFLLLQQLGAATGAALAGAAIFAVHPVHVEAVANVVGRAEILAALFFLAAAIAHLRWRRGWLPTAAIALLYLLSLLSKEIGATLPAALLLLNWIRAGRGRLAVTEALGAWRRYGVLALTLAGYFVLRAVNIGALLGHRDEAAWFLGMPARTHLWTAIRVWPEYLRLMLFPVDLVPDYGPGVIMPETTPWSALVLAGALVGLLLVLLVWRLRREARLVSGAVAWFAITVLPVSGVLFAAGVILAERTLYLPSVAVAMAVAGAATWIRERQPGWTRVAAAALVVVVAAGGVRTWRQNPVWEDSLSVINHLFRAHPENYRAQWGVATHFLERGDTVRALSHLRLAARLVPGYHNVRLQYGEVLRKRGEWAEAAEEFAMAWRLIPSSEAAQLYLVESLVEAGRPDSAVVVARDAVERYAGSEVAYHLLARSLARTGDLAGAVQARSRAAELSAAPGTWVHLVNLAGLHLQAGDTVRAARVLDRARALPGADARVPSVSVLARDLEREGPGVLPLW